MAKDSDAELVERLERIADNIEAGKVDDLGLVMRDMIAAFKNESAANSSESPATETAHPTEQDTTDPDKPPTQDAPSAQNT